MKLNQLRTKYPKFFYKGYSYKLQRGDLHISFDFRVPALSTSSERSRTGVEGSPDVRFQPKVIIQNIGRSTLPRVRKNILDNLVFHLGMMELPSYWKATCSPQIIVEAAPPTGKLNTAQIAWWKNLFIQGLGEFFYQNNIDFTPKNFLTIKSLGEGAPASAPSAKPTAFPNFASVGRSVSTLIPVGGGKDSAVTLELLKNTKIQPFILNPKPPQLAIIKKANAKTPIIALRTIDPKLLELNRKGFLNGHTPFSAYLAFLTTLTATLFDFKYIAVSNERSSNEGNMKYRGRIINHQYSKSFDFEKRFRSYSKTYLVPGLEYFSFLRPLSELQIAKIFGKFPKYFSAFLAGITSGTSKPRNSPILCAISSVHISEVTKPVL